MSGLTPAHRIIGRGGGKGGDIPVVLSVVVVVVVPMSLLFSPIPVTSLAYPASILITSRRRHRAASTCQKNLAPRTTTTASTLAEENVDDNMEERSTLRRIRSKGVRKVSRLGRLSSGRQDSGQRGGYFWGNCLSRISIGIRCCHPRGYCPTQRWQRRTLTTIWRRGQHCAVSVARLTSPPYCRLE